jgi:hypothetical protein
MHARLIDPSQHARSFISTRGASDDALAYSSISVSVIWHAGPQSEPFG